jgi:hypothetical protein
MEKTRWYPYVKGQSLIPTTAYKRDKKFLVPAHQLDDLHLQVMLKRRAKNAVPVITEKHVRKILSFIEWSYNPLTGQKEPSVQRVACLRKLLGTKSKVERSKILNKVASASNPAAYLTGLLS